MDMERGSTGLYRVVNQAKITWGRDQCQGETANEVGIGAKVEANEHCWALGVDKVLSGRKSREMWRKAMLC